MRASRGLDEARRSFAERFWGTEYASLVVALIFLVGLPYSFTQGSWPGLGQYFLLSLVGVGSNLLLLLFRQHLPTPTLNLILVGSNLAWLTVGVGFLGGMAGPFALAFAVYVLALGLLRGWRGAWEGLLGALVCIILLTVLVRRPPFPDAWLLLSIHGALLCAVGILAGSVGYGYLSLYRSEVRRRQSAEALREVALALGSTRRPGELLDLILEQLARVVPYDSACVLLLEGDELRIAAARGHPPEAQEGILNLRFPTRPGNVDYDALQSERYLLIPDVGRDPRWRVFPGTAQIRCWIGVPLLSRGETLGLLGIDGNTPGQFTEDDAEAARAFAGQAAVALENARLYASLLQQLQEVTTLNEVARVLSTTLERGELLEAIRQQVTSIMECDSYFLALYDGDAGALQFELLVDRGRRYPPFRHPIGRGPSWRVIESREPLLVADLPEEAGSLGLEVQTVGDEQPSRSWLGVPLEAGGRVRGLMAVTSYQPAAYAESDLILLQNIARQVALALENSRLYEEARLRMEELEKANQEIIAARDRLVKAERAAALAQLGATMQHEINNPLTVVIGHVALILKGRQDLPPDLRETLETVMVHSERIRDILRRLQTVEDRLTTYVRSVKMVDLERAAEEILGEEDGGREGG